MLIYLRESLQQSPQKAHLLGELADAKRSLAHKEEEMRQLVERMQRLEDTQERLARERRRELMTIVQPQDFRPTR